MGRRLIATSDVPWYIGASSIDRWRRREAAKLDPPTTPEAQRAVLVDTLTLCRDNPAFLLHEFGQIRQKAGGRLAFNAWTPAQRLLYSHAVRQYLAGLPVRLIILKARQMGVSTICQGLLFWRTSFFPDANSVIVAHEEDAATNLFGMFQLFHDGMPDILRQPTTQRNISEMVFDNPDAKTRQSAPGLGSRVSVRTVALGGASKANQGKGRSFAFQGAHFSEAAYWAEPERFWNGIAQSLPSAHHTWAFVESTANGWGNWFHGFWRRASRGYAMAPDPQTGLVSWRCVDPSLAVSAYAPVFLSYLEHPEYRAELPFDADDTAMRASYEHDLDPEERQLVTLYGASLEQVEWRRRTIADNCNGDIEVFHTEYPLTPDHAFRVSGRHVFDMGALLKVEEALLDNPIVPSRCFVETDGTFHADEFGCVLIYRHPLPGHDYVLGVDGSYGKPDGDFSCVQVLDKTTWEQVAIAHARLDADRTAEVACGLGRLYRGSGEMALAVVETDGPGTHLQARMQDDGYWNLYRRILFDAVSKAPQPSYGWVSSAKARGHMVHAMRAAVRDGSLVLVDHETVAEMREWVIVTNANSGKAKEQPADPTHGHDDRITAIGIALVGGCIEDGIGGIIVSKKTDTPVGKPPAAFDIGPDFGAAQAHDVLGECF